MNVRPRYAEIIDVWVFLSFLFDYWFSLFETVFFNWYISINGQNRFLQTDFVYLHPIRKYSLLKFEVVRSRAKFCMFLASIFGGSPNVWTCVIKLGILPIMVQNFAAIGRRSSEFIR